MLLVEDLDAFRDAVRRVDNTLKPWERFVRGLPETTDLRIFVSSDCNRGIVDPDETEGLFRLWLSDRVMFRIALPAPHYFVFLVEDTMGWQCFWPKPGVADDASPTFAFPRERNGLARYAFIDSLGIHRALAVVSEEPLPPEVRGVLQQNPLQRAALDTIAGRLQTLRSEGRCSFLSRRFFVIAQTVMTELEG